jgi:hypothetical protein
LSGLPAAGCGRRKKETPFNQYGPFLGASRARARALTGFIIAEVDGFAIEKQFKAIKAAR